MSTHRTNPWAGLASYQDPETAEVKLKFCGRDKESYDVAQLIDDNICVTLYGKSGTGKTSLLNAGVFPRLRHQQYLPVSIRLAAEARESSFQRCIVEKVSRVASSAGSVQTFDVVPMPSDEKSIDYLWHFFARSRFVAADGRVLFPVMVFDQFEEVFRGRRDEAEILLRQIHFMMDESHTLADRLVDGHPYSYDFNFRFVLSLREDDLYRLEDSIDNCYLPEMKRCRYRLRSLSDNAARDVVLISGEGLFRQSEQDAIATTIVNTARNNEDHTISTNILSLICSRIFVEWQSSGSEYITPSLVETFVKGNPFERFYNEATRGCSNREKTYIEEHLVDSEGRRNSIPEKDLQHNISNWRRLLEGDNRILQRIASSADSSGYRVELLHDSFCEPLLGQKEKRAKRRRLKWLAFTLAISIFLVSIV
ncbi:MAG: ATP-binding protein, partial [Bacteroidales bacterium]|nr:ATP-binding protein [Bacteroidales bacterium]